MYQYVSRSFLKLSFQRWELSFDMFVTWEVGHTYSFREIFFQLHHGLRQLEAHAVIAETCLDFIIILLSVIYFTVYS